MKLRLKWLALGLLGWLLPSQASLDYLLVPRRVANDTYVFVGETEDFSRANGGNIVNTGFIVTSAGVVVIDTGPSRRYGLEMRRAIAQVTSKPVLRVFLTHHHPDHFLGNQAFEDVPIAALPQSIEVMRRDGNAFAENLYRMAGDWMSGTEAVPATEAAQVGVQRIGDHELELIASKGHTDGDLVVFDRTSGVLFAGDLVFWQRAATTPHATLGDWQAALDMLNRLRGWKVLVPGHGEPLSDASGIEQTRRYLTWLDATFRRAAQDGMDMPELMRSEIPKEFSSIPLVRSEFTRSIAHLYRHVEQETLAQPR